MPITNSGYTFSFNFLGLILLCIGLGLGWFSLYTLYENVYLPIVWTKTSAQVVGTVEREDSDGFYIYEKAVFKDSHGKSVEVISKTSPGSLDPASGEVTVFYDPKNSDNAMIFFWRNFLPVFFLPFALLLIWLGWPFKRREKRMSLR